MAHNSINFCFCLPYTSEEFDATGVSENHDFVKYFNTVRAKSNENNYYFYQQEICKPYQQLKTAFSPLGINFMDSFCLDSLRHLLKDTNAVIIIFSHCMHGGDIDQEKIEFCDGLYGWRLIMDVIPNEFEGVIDLAVCKPEALARQLKFQRPQCVVKSSSRRIQIIYWLYFYFELFNNVVQQKLDYLDALPFTYLNLKNKYDSKA